MFQQLENKGILLLYAVGLAACIVAVVFIWQGTKGFNLADEGFLWYGAQRVMQGEVPLRDFMAYDPGRYYWSAALMRLWGDDGIMALRGAVAVFQVIGLATGLLLVACAVGRRHLLFLHVTAVTLVVWMTPYYKLMDMSVSILLIGVLTYLISKPTGRRYFMAGLGVGLAAVFGRNHGVYGLAGSIGVLIWLNIRCDDVSRPIKQVLLWMGGVLTGYLPIVFMVLLVPGFAEAFWASVLYLFEFRATNLPLPIPWPWQVRFAAIPLGDAIRQVLIGVFFISVLVFGVASLVWVFREKLRGQQKTPALVAASCLGLPYAHYAFARADVEHLALGVFPLLIGCLVLLATQPAMLRWSLTLILCFASLLAMLHEHPGWQCRVSKQWVDVEVSGNNLTVAPSTANGIQQFRTLVEKFAPDGQKFMVTPWFPGINSLMGQQSIVWEIYPILPRSQKFQQREVDRIRKADPAFIYILDAPLDGREELRYSNTHHVIYRYIIENFQRIPISTSEVHQLYVAKNSF